MTVGTAVPSLAGTRERFWQVRSLTEALAEPLSAEDQTVQSMPDVSPTKWHRAHTSWFFEEFVLGPQMSGYAVFHPTYTYLFNSYYETVGPRHPRPERGLLSRPGIDDIAAYRRHVDLAMLDLLGGRPTDRALGLVELGLHHEQQHQELLLMDIKHVLSQSPLDPSYRRTATLVPTAASALRWVERPGGVVEIGHDGAGFAFDNERPRHLVHLAPFALASRPVTNAEWLAFIDDGGYRRAERWLSDGWAAVQSHDWSAPLYWREEGADWSIFTLAGRRSLDPAEPVCHVSFYEAEAYARWAGARLATEAEWEHVVATDPSRADVERPSFHPRPTPGSQPGETTGEVWEWTATPYTAYPGFRPDPGAVGEYNGKFMVNQQVLRGSACVTPPGHGRTTYRNFYPPGARWPFTGVRLARDL